MNAMLLAAGLGTRFRPHTEFVAKPAIPFLNLPLIAYPMYHLLQTNMQQLVVNTHHLPKTLLSTTNSFIDELNIKTQFIEEQPQILDSGGGIANASQYLEVDDHFVVINADEIFIFKNGENLNNIIEAHRSSGALATLLTMPHAEAGKSFGGVEVESDGSISNLGTDTQTEKTRHFTGVYVFSKDIFNYMPKDKIFHIFRNCLIPAIKAGQKIMAYNTENIAWYDVTSEKTYLDSTKKVLREIWGKSEIGKQFLEIFKFYKKNYTQTHPNIWLGERAELKCTPSDESLVMVGDGSIINQSVGIKGFAVFGPNVHFDQGFVEESVIASGAHLHEMVALRNQLLLQPESVGSENQIQT